MDAIWFNQGQVCCAGSRLLVQENIADTADRQAARAHGDSCAWATRWTKRWTSAQSSRRCSWRRFSAWCSRAWTRARRCGSPRGPARPRATSSRPRSSPTCRRRRPSPRWRSSARCWSSMTFRTPAEAVALANNTRYGLAASVWSENINLALDVARQIKAGTVWINCTNLFDAASGFGGYRESGYGREGGKEGLVRICATRLGSAAHARAHDGAAGDQQPSKAHATAAQADRARTSRSSDRRSRQRQRLHDAGARLPTSTARPSSSSAASRRGRIPAIARRSTAQAAQMLGEVGEGNRKDIRNAVEAAHAAAAAGPAPRRITARRSSTTSPRTWRCAPRSSRGASLR